MAVSHSLHCPHLQSHIGGTFHTPLKDGAGDERSSAERQVPLVSLLQQVEGSAALRSMLLRANFVEQLLSQKHDLRSAAMFQPVSRELEQLVNTLPEMQLLSGSTGGVGPGVGQVFTLEAEYTASLLEGAATPAAAARRAVARCSTHSKRCSARHATGLSVCHAAFGVPTA